ncbi:MAG: hypothetical protein QXP36_06660, partial [Conexivisphaerales archaeon]
MTDIFVRPFTDSISKSSHREEINHNHNIRLIFDTETTIDQYQNPTFGSCLIKTKISSGFKEEWYLFYWNISNRDNATNEDYGKERNNNVMSVREFVDNVFYPYAYKMRAEIIVFNIPFGLSRLAIDYGIS